jgi:YD repeat-containing protein
MKIHQGDFMSSNHSRARRAFLSVSPLLLAGTSLLATAPCQAADTDYTYDALGRLIAVSRPDGTQTNYTLDAAGNRTQLFEGGVPNAPASIAAPTSNTSGSYLVSWTAPASGTAATRYELHEATNVSFSGQTLIYDNSSLSFTTSGRVTGHYYYRVRACSAVGCGAYATRTTPVAVVATPATPTNFRAWNPAQQAWRADWDGVPGATSYRFQDWAGIQQTIPHRPSPPGGKQYVDYHCADDCQTNRPKWVQACNGSDCGAKAQLP